MIWISLKRLIQRPLDEIAVALSAIGLIFCALVLGFDSLYEELFKLTSSQSEMPRLGEIVEANNDVRYREGSSFGWSSAAVHRPIHLGDSVFSGDDSSLSVRLDDQTEIELKENSLVRFVEVGGVRVPALILGRVRVRAGKRTKFIVNGRLIEVQGRNFEMDVNTSAKAEALLIAGEAQMIVDGRVQSSPETQSLAEVISPPTVAAKPPAEPLSAPKPIQLRRSPTSAVEAIRQLNPLRPSFKNDRYNDSYIAIETSGAAMYSKVQVAQNLKTPVVATVGVRASHWVGKNGWEGVFRTRMMDLAGGTSVSPLFLEGRYQRRWSLPFNPLSEKREIGVVGILGLEYYRNTQDVYFASTYKLIKVGGALRLPVLRSWDTGGELLYGSDLNTTAKYEASGYFTYYFDRLYDLRCGYRVHLVDIDGDAAPSATRDYREGYGELFLGGQWRY